jgi:hypothetical protein
MELKEFKKIYSELEKKYRLPAFNKINEDFDIEKIDRDSEIVTRNIRKVMMEKIINSLTFLEMLLNPVNSPRMYLSYIKNMSLEDKNVIEEIYSDLSTLSVEVLDLEIDSAEKIEASMVIKIFDVWQLQKPRFRRIFTNMKKPNNISTKKEKTYFG